MHIWTFPRPAPRALRAEDGAVTVDWVVLVALLVPLGFAVGSLIWGETNDAARRVGDVIGTQDVEDGQ